MKQTAGSGKISGFRWGGEPIVAYVELETELPIFKSGAREEGLQEGIIGYAPYVMRLPYTRAQWERRQARLVTSEGSER